MPQREQRTDAPAAAAVDELPAHSTFDEAKFNPNPVLLQLAKEPASATLPRQQRQRAPSKVGRARIPLQSSLVGAGRAGTVTTLTGSCGSRYHGQVLAGRPHGRGQLWLPGPQPGQPLQLAYEGEFVRGVRHGGGTAHRHSTGELFTGTFVNGQCTGPGKLSYADGSVYQGTLVTDRKHGVGTQTSSDGGSIFVGTFANDLRQGLGVTFWGGRCKKLVAEYVDDAPRCGNMLDLDDDTIEPPPSQALRQAIAAARIRAAAQGAAAAGNCSLPQMPGLTLAQPSRVLGMEFAAVRRQREHEDGAALAAPGLAMLHPTSSTLTSNTMDLLRHAAVLIAGGDDLAAHVLPHQLQELVVLAGLDPAAEPVLNLMEQLRARAVGDGCNKLHLEDLLDVVNHFRGQPLEHSAWPAPADAAADANEEWQPASVADVDVLAQHIAAHQRP